MKALIFISSLLVLFLGCTSQPDCQLTEQQKEEIKAEAKTALDSLIMKFEEVNVKGALGFYWNSPDFIAIDGTGELGDYASNEKVATEFGDMSSSIKLTTYHEKYRVFTKDIVLCTWIGKEEVELKSGGNLVFDPMAETLILQKIDGKWKVAYDHQSATMLPQETEEK